MTTPSAEESAPEFYADQFLVTTGVYTVTFSFAVNPPHPTPGRPPQPQTQCVVRMSPPHAKVMAMLLRRQIKQYEEKSGTEILIPLEVLNDLGLSPEDWGKIS
ncbi:MAG TPA: DUF3467 domain-containing protein [Thermoleophilia bacterium]|nr:DUF3467 domain-containing protein [Thermoleophilia bacterium]